MIKLNCFTSFMVLNMLFISPFSHAVNNNPASIDYVNEQIANSRYQAGTGILINGNTISTTATYEVGDIAQGGVIVYLDETKRHGLALSLVDVTNLSPFSVTPPNTTTSVAISTVANGINGGLTNTAAIIGAYSGYGLSTTAGATAITAYAAKSAATS